MLITGVPGCDEQEFGLVVFGRSPCGVDSRLSPPFVIDVNLQADANKDGLENRSAGVVMPELEKTPIRGHR